MDNASKSAPEIVIFPVPSLEHGFLSASSLCSSETKNEGTGLPSVSGDDMGPYCNSFSSREEQNWIFLDERIQCK